MWFIVDEPFVKISRTARTNNGSAQTLKCVHSIFNFYTRQAKNLLWGLPTCSPTQGCQTIYRATHMPGVKKHKSDCGCVASYIIVKDSFTEQGQKMYTPCNFVHYN